MCNLAVVSVTAQEAKTISTTKRKRTEDDEDNTPRQRHTVHRPILDGDTIAD